jgi:phosphonopyruvate decarboxylase
MINTETFFKTLKSNNVNFFTGVPDSLLKDICSYIDDSTTKEEHLISANEGTAFATALGYHLATGSIPLVYMQNSGLGNIVNPLTSLADQEVYSIPMVLMIGWRGEPGVKDEPQHVKMGRVTEDILNAMEVPTYIIGNETDYEASIKAATTQAKEESRPVAILIQKGAFEAYKSSKPKIKHGELSREEAIEAALKGLKSDDVIVSTTGKTSRELYELRISRGEAGRDFLTVGGMGHTSSIALGVALGEKNKRVVCLDGDGSVLMHMGAMTNIGDQLPSNYVHIVLNNSAHDSVGGQATVAGNVDLEGVFKACGYKQYFCARTTDEIENTLKSLGDDAGPVVLEIKIKTGARSELGRPKSTPIENKNSFMEAIRG